MSNPDESWYECEQELNAANARADEAESRFEDMREWCETKEYEAASLRAEVDYLRGEHLHPCGAEESELIELRAQVERLRGTKTRVREAQLMHSLAEARALLEGLEDLLEQTMTNTPHPPSYSDCKEGSANIRAWLAANPESPRSASFTSEHEAAERRAVAEAARSVKP